MKARELWAPTAPAVTLDDPAGVLSTSAAAAPVASAFDEFDRPDVCLIGSVVAVEESRLRLLELDVAAGWARRPRMFGLADAT